MSRRADPPAGQSGGRRAAHYATIRAGPAAWPSHPRSLTLTRSLPEAATGPASPGRRRRAPAPPKQYTKLCASLTAHDLARSLAQTQSRAGTGARSGHEDGWQHYVQCVCVVCVVSVITGHAARPRTTGQAPESQQRLRALTTENIALIAPSQDGAGWVSGTIRRTGSS